MASGVSIKTEPMESMSDDINNSLATATVVKDSTNMLEDLEDSTYYFETDHLALKDNADYRRLLRNISLLESQRQQSIKDLDRIIDIKEEALKDPIEFVQKLQRKADVGLPPKRKIAELPEIDWAQYTKVVEGLGATRHKTRGKKGDHSHSLAATLQGTNKSLLDTQVPSPLMDDIESSDNIIVRGRLKDESKSQTFNQLWTDEEQKRLEALLIEYPPEEIETHRYQKIAYALGNRTMHQVASRVQKYFIKLAKAGLPIPGRMPNMKAYKDKNKPVHHHHRHKHLYYQPSTFMQSYNPPVYMSDDDGESYMGDAYSLPSKDDDSSDDDIPSHLASTNEYLELMQLKSLRKRKIKEIGPPPFEHKGFKCDRCNCDPIIGKRWHCIDCSPDSFDFCDDCADSQYEIGQHNSSHRLKQVEPPQSKDSHIDRDYTGFTPGDYSYLDPNFMPAS
ncbi:unnamed protein product [Owenia fusiformis]|uniref:Uncharacterized protein n=1 Tax=Owenia fusiformis TaxID=6347 RepID=A0A8J1V093_OWEFU|nr:unnamed protein product [Owenia fusiformis]